MGKVPPTTSTEKPDKPFLSTADAIKRGPAQRECIASGGKWNSATGDCEYPPKRKN